MYSNQYSAAAQAQAMVNNESPYDRLLAANSHLTQQVKQLRAREARLADLRKLAERLVTTGRPSKGCQQLAEAIFALGDE